MGRISVQLPDELVATINEAAAQLRRTRAEVVRQAIEYYLEDFQDISLAIQALRDPADPISDWEQVRRKLFN